MILVARLLSTSCSKKERQVYLTSLLFLYVLIVTACDNRPTVELLRFSGETMGTSYHVTIVSDRDFQVPENLQQEIQSRLDAVNQSMSTYLPDSELSALNQLPVGVSKTVSEPLFTVINDAVGYGRLSDGALDITIAPIVDLWGFGPVDQNANVPSEKSIEDALNAVGFDYIELDANTLSIRKTRPLTIDLSSIAKGYGSDSLGIYLASLGFENYLIEIGGDLLVAGKNGRGEAWRIGVEKPTVDYGDVQQAIAVSDVGVATSGDYRNFFETEGATYSHIIDPRTGRPVKHNLVSVTVIAKSAREADALATAMTVLGADDALALAEREGLAVYLIERNNASDPDMGENQFSVRYSTTFKSYID